jgi:hypothetical protein
LLPQGATLHVAENHHLIAAKLKLKPNPKGKIKFLAKFGKQNCDNNNKIAYIADPLLVHAELMIESDDRLEETAEIIFSKYIEERQHSSQGLKSLSKS